jgi:hypothetical protein
VQQETQRELLLQIADDERRPAHERDAARRATATADQPTPSTRRHGRNANAPQTQDDIDADLDQALTFRPTDGLTTQDRIAIQKKLPESTRAILDAISSNCLIGIYRQLTNKRNGNKIENRFGGCSSGAWLKA